MEASRKVSGVFWHSSATAGDAGLDELPSVADAMAAPRPSPPRAPRPALSRRRGAPWPPQRPEARGRGEAPRGGAFQAGLGAGRATERRVVNVGARGRARVGNGCGGCWCGVGALDNCVFCGRKDSRRKSKVLFCLFGGKGLKGRELRSWSVASAGLTLEFAAVRSCPLITAVWFQRQKRSSELCGVSEFY